MLPVKDLFSRLKYGLVAGAMALTALGQATPAAAQTATASIGFDQSTYSAATVAAGSSITVNVVANTNQVARGWQFGVTYDPSVVTLTDVGGGAAGNVAYGDAFLTSQRPTGATVFSTTGTIDNTAGSLSVGGDAYLGGTGGATGTGVLATLHFHAVANGSAALTLAPSSHLVAATGNLATTLGTANVNIGPVSAADLTVASATTVATATPAGATFNVTFTVSNIGTLGAGASTTTVAVVNATPASVTVPTPALAAAATSATLTAGPFTLATGQTLANVTVTADSASVVAESNESNNATTTAYSFAAFSSNGQTQINANYGGFLRLTAPGLETATFIAGQNNEFGSTSPLDDLNVRSNLSSWNVTVSGDNTGHFTEFDPGTSAYVPTPAQLVQSLSIRTDGTLGPLSISGTPQAYVSGTRATSNPNTGNTYTITYDQFVGFNDAPVNAPHIYHITLTWAAAGTF